MIESTLTLSIAKRRNAEATWRTYALFVYVAVHGKNVLKIAKAQHNLRKLYLRVTFNTCLDEIT
jgi:hypothetical protein